MVLMQEFQSAALYNHVKKVVCQPFPQDASNTL